MRFTTRPELIGTFGVVSSTHWLASSAAMGVLERGGNAFDAAVAAGFVLQVAEPHLNGPGGEMPALIFEARRQRIRVLCGQGPAPARATIGAFRDLSLDLIPGTGLLASCVPGAVDAWLLMLRDFGTIEFHDVIAPAIHYAETGVPMLPKIVDALGGVVDLFTREWQSSAAIYVPGGQPPKHFDMVPNVALASTFRRLAEISAATTGSRESRIEAVRDAWSTGFVAEAIDRFCRSTEVLDSSGRRHRGFLTGDDMAHWRASLEEPLIYEYHGWTVAKCGPWTQGPVFLQQLALLKGYDLGGLDVERADFVHLVTETSKLAFADREAWYGDPAFVDVPMADLLSDDYQRERRGLITESASLELRPGQPGSRGPRMATIPSAAGMAAGIGEPTTGKPPPAWSAPGVGEPTAARLGSAGVVRGDTCHVDVIDRYGNMVSATPSGGWFQSSPVIPGLGFCLGTRAQMFWLEENVPNALMPGKRPRTTLTPTLALHADGAGLVFGTPGGDQQDQWSLQVFLKHVHGGMNLQECIDSPAFHSEHFPSSFYPREARLGYLAVEGRFADETVCDLRRRGHVVDVMDDWSEGRVSACKMSTNERVLTFRAAANPRGMQGYAVGR